MFRLGNTSVKDIFSSTSVLLILANLYPLIGVLFLGWSIYEVILIYWIESAIVGFYNIIKMLWAGRFNALFEVVFFIIHYGGFMLGHLFALEMLFGIQEGVFNIDAIIGTLLTVKVAIVALIISHGISFAVNFVGKKEYTKQVSFGLFFAPYKRIIFMHLAVLFGGMITVAVGSGIAVLVILIFFKIAVDVFSHMHEHKKLQT